MDVEVALQRLTVAWHHHLHHLQASHGRALPGKRLGHLGEPGQAGGLVGLVEQDEALGGAGDDRQVGSCLAVGENAQGAAPVGDLEEVDPTDLCGEREAGRRTVEGEAGFGGGGPVEVPPAAVTAQVAKDRWNDLVGGASLVDRQERERQAAT